MRAKAILSLAIVSLPLFACSPTPSQIRVPVEPEWSSRGYPGRLTGYLIINIDACGHRILNQSNCDSDQVLIDHLARAYALNPDSEINLRADERCPYNSVMRVLLIAKKAGFSSFALTVRDGTIEQPFKLRYDNGN